MTSRVYFQVEPHQFKPYDKDGMAGPLPLWQNEHAPNLFSTDGGETYYDLNEDLDPDGNPVIHNTENIHA